MKKLIIGACVVLSILVTKPAWAQAESGEMITALTLMLSYNQADFGATRANLFGFQGEMESVFMGPVTATIGIGLQGGATRKRISRHGTIPDWGTLLQTGRTCNSLYPQPVRPLHRMGQKTHSARRLYRSGPCVRRRY